MPPRLNRVISVLFPVLSLPAFAAPPRPVAVDSGKVQGVATADAKVMAFKGIPFAAPPVGKLRWAPPPPPTRGRACVRRLSSVLTASSPARIPTCPFTIPAPREDCLTLNVWTPADASSSRQDCR